LRRALSLGLAFAVLRALPAGAAEFELGVNAGVVYDDNVFSSPTDPQDDFIANAGPRLRLVDERGSVTWELRYWPTYQKYLDLKEADDWDHDFSGTLAWALSPRTSLRITERYLDSSNITAAFSEQGGPDPFIEPVLQIGRNRVKLNQFQASLTHLLTPRQDVALGVGYHDTDYGGGLETEVTTLGGSWRYALTPVDRVGFGIGAVRQDVGVEPIYFYSGSLQWIHQFDPTLVLDAAVGPAWVDRPAPEFPEVLSGRSRYPAIRTSEGIAPIRASSCRPIEGGLFALSVTCRPIPAGTVFESFAFLLEAVDLPRLGDEPDTDSAITYFAAIDLTKRWREFTAAVSYNRDASTTSSVGGLVSDTLSVSVAWLPPARPWRVSFWGSFGRREYPGTGTGVETVIRGSTVAGVSDVAEAVGFRLIEVERNQTVDVYLAGLYASYNFTPRSQIYLNVTWQREEFDFEFSGATRRWDGLRIALGYVYTFPRINLPI
jgi:hypothetical protein